MKNIHVLPTEKPSRFKQNNITKKISLVKNKGIDLTAYTAINIYITSDEEIKDGDWCFHVNNIYKVLRINSNNRPIIKMSDGTFEISYYKKIILTTDQDLIKDSVQAIDDEFLEWFVNNPSCESVETVFNNRGVTGVEKILKTFGEYKIIIPSEEAKQETLEEVKPPIGKFIIDNAVSTQGADGAYYHYSEVCKLLKLQQERMYSEEEVIKFGQYLTEFDNLHNEKEFIIKQLFEQFKNE